MWTVSAKNASLMKKEAVTAEALVNRMASTDEARLKAELTNEFNEIAAQTPGFDAFRQHPARNRYQGNVFLYDHTRVQLKDHAEGDYINASYVSTTQQSRRFILTQAPLPETINDFWHMVAQEQSQVIVCLCQFDDPNAPSPDDPFPIYWPQSADATMTFGSVAVKCQRAETIENTIKITHMEWKRGQEKPRHLVHMHLLVEGWEAGGMPTRQLMVFMDRVWEAEAEMMKANKNPGLPTPMIVHCASGTARSGQFTALAIATEAIRRSWPFSVKEILCSLQAQRYGVFREATQVYALVYAIVEYARIHQRLQYLPANLEKVLGLIADALSGRSQSS